MKTKFIFIIMLTVCSALSAFSFSEDEVFQFYEHGVMDSVRFIDLVDVNKDGHLDLIYTPAENYFNFDPATRELFRVQYGDGTLNGLINSENYDMMRLPYLPVIEDMGFIDTRSDLNNDGFCDLVVVRGRYIYINFNWRNTDDFIGTYLEYDEEPDLPSFLTRYTSLIVERHGPHDFNGDGIDDLLVEPRREAAQVGGFIPSTYIYFGGDSFDIHNPDVEIRSEAISFTENTLINRGMCATGDFDGDGIDDLIVTVEFDRDIWHRNQSIPLCNTFRVYWGGENFGEEFTDYTTPESFNADGMTWIVASDINNNGRTDLRTFLRNYETEYIISFDEERNVTFYTADDFYGNLPYCFIDINGDGLNDSLHHLVTNNGNGYIGYARLGEHSPSFINFSEIVFQVTGFPQDPVEGNPERYFTISGLSDTNHGVLLTTHYNPNNWSQSWIRFFVSEDLSSVSEDIVQEIISPLNISIYPLPFTDELNIKIDSKLQSPVNISIFNIKGQKIREFSDIDSKKLSWDGKDLFGKAVSSGIYFVKVKQDNHQQIKKIIKMK